MYVTVINVFLANLIWGIQFATPLPILPKEAEGKGLTPVEVS